MGLDSPSGEATVVAQVRRAWGWLGTPGSVRAIGAGMLAYALVIGLLVYGYARVSSCNSRYAEASATATAARIAIAAEDRVLDESDRALDDSDREAGQRSDKALDVVLQALAEQDEAKSAAAFTELLKVRGATAATYALNNETRKANKATRAANEEERRRNPAPPPPSQSC